MVGYETQETQHIHAFKNLRVDSTGTRVVFEAGGLSYWQKVGNQEADKVPVTDKSAAYYSPSFVPFHDDLVVHARWSDAAYTTFELADLKEGKAYEIEGIPFGRYFSPILCACKGSKRTIAFLKTGGTYLSGDILATAGAGLYVGDVVLPESLEDADHTIKVENLRFVPSEIDTDDRVNMRFLKTNTQLLVQQSDRGIHHRLRQEGGQVWKVPPTPHSLRERRRENWPYLRNPRRKGSIPLIALHSSILSMYISLQHTNVRDGEAVWSKPGNATKGLIRLSLDGGHDINWSPDGKKLLWFLGTYQLSHS